MTRRLVVATRNEGKLREVAALLNGLPVQVVSLGDYPDAPEVDEPFETFCENASHKACSIAQHTGQWALSDDSGLVVDALGGEPGVRSARIASNDPERIAWVLERMRQVPDTMRTARFVCAIALAAPQGVLGVWERGVEGIIAVAAQGTGGFGFDPVFHYPPAQMTFAQMSMDEKGLVSHRGQALRAFLSDLPALLSGSDAR